MYGRLAESHAEVAGLCLQCYFNRPPRTHETDGSHDWMDEDAAHEVAPRMPAGAKVYQIPRAGHHLYMENPTDYNRHIIHEVLTA